MFRGCIIFALLGIGLASYSANQHVDNILQTSFLAELRAFSLDPAALYNFTVRYPYVAFDGSVIENEYTRGNAIGFSRLRRSSDCQGPTLLAGQYSTNCTFTLDSLVTHYDIRRIQGRAYHEISSTAHINETLIDAQILGQDFGDLRSFKVSRLGLIYPITFNGEARVIDFVRKESFYFYKRNLNDYLLDVINYKVRYALELAMANNPMSGQ